MNLKNLTLTSASLAFISLTPLTASELLNETFETADSILNWVGAPIWSSTEGNPAGSVIVSNNVQPSNKNYTIDIPVELTEPTDITVSFDAKSIVNVAGVFHFYVEPEGYPQFFIDFNNEAEINNATYTTRTFVVKDVPASATFVTLRFEMITGAVQGADVRVAIDNILVTGPEVDPAGTWKGLLLVDGFWTEEVNGLGSLYVESDPWIYSSTMQSWFYLPEDSRLVDGNVWVNLTGL